MSCEIAKRLQETTVSRELPQPPGPRRVPVALAAILMVTIPCAAHAQSRPSSLTIGMYAPAAGFANSSEALTYINRVAADIQTRTGIPTRGKSFLRYADLRKAKVDLALLSGLCLNSSNASRVLAATVVGGKTTQRWGLYARSGGKLIDLKNNRLGYLKTGCRDKEFLGNAMLEGEVSLGFFGSLVGKPNIGGVLSAVTSYKIADAVFAPLGTAGKLSKIFDAGLVPTPALVQLGGGLSAAVVDEIREAVLSSSARGGLFSGFAAAEQAHWSWFDQSLRRRTKRPLFAAAKVETLLVVDVLSYPALPPLSTSTDHHFIAAPTRP